MAEPFPPVPLWEHNKVFYVCGMPSLTTVNSCPCNIRGVNVKGWMRFSSQSLSPALFLTYLDLPHSFPLPGCRCAHLAMSHYYDLSDCLDISKGSYARLACELQLTSQITFYVWRSRDVFYVLTMGRQLMAYIFRCIYSLG